MRTLRWGTLLVIALGALACLQRYEYHFTKNDVIGTFEQDGGEGGPDIQVRADGTFSRTYPGSAEVGTWRLIDAEYALFDTGIEFDGGPKGSEYGNEYLLTRRRMRVCWEVREDEEYFCKKDA